MVSLFYPSHSLRRGCQVPWNYNPAFPMGKCEHLDNITEIFNTGVPDNHAYYFQAFYSTLNLAQESGCRLPCTTTSYDVDTSYFQVYNGPYVDPILRGA